MDAERSGQRVRLMSLTGLGMIALNPIFKPFPGNERLHLSQKFFAVSFSFLEGIFRF